MSEESTNEIGCEPARVFGIFRSSSDAERAVHGLADSGVALSSIAVLHPGNEDTREFSRRLGTRCPAGTAEGLTASLPLDGTMGLTHPQTGPVEGALSVALADMGVPANWCDYRVVNGRILVSAATAAESAESAADILRRAGAADVEWVSE